MAIENEDLLIWESYVEESMKLVEDLTDKYKYYNSYQTLNGLIEDFQEWSGKFEYKFDKETRKRLDEFFNDIIDLASAGFQGFLNRDRKGVLTFSESIEVKPKNGKEFNIQVIFKLPPAWMGGHEHKEGLYILKIT